jgi:tetratricopeptide (TPR) repeat protein
MPTKPVDEVLAGRFRLTKKLARGGSAEVFAAVDQSTGQRVALKRLLDHHGKHGAAARFMREYYALSELRHPRIIEVYDYGVDRNDPYYTMELLDGHDLSELSPLPYREACGYLRDVASSLALLHARRLLHRDVSPRNVRRTSDGRCKLLDFGAMIPFGTPANVTGTPPCIPPEALQGGTLDQRSDLYSLGALAYFVLTGRHAYAANELRSLPEQWQVDPVSPKRRVPELPEALDDLVLALMDLDLEKRPASAAEVIDRLSAIADLPADDNLAVGRSFLVSSQLIGRSRECAQLQARVSKVAEGNGSATLIRGAAGTGKTRMLAAAALYAQTCGLLVVRTALRKQRGVSSSFLQDVVTGLRQVAPAESEYASARWPLVRAALSGTRSPSNQTELLSQAEKYVREVASARPLLLTIDDLQHADELADGLVAALAHHAGDCSLAIVASHDGQGQGSALTIARGLVTTLQLEGLDRSQVALLTASLFGDVPNSERIGDWFFRIARGNPKMTLELAHSLLARGTLRYVDGSWVLPTEIAEPLPEDTAHALLSRLTSLAADARAIAELLSVRRGGASAEQLLALAAPKPPDQVFRALEELVREGILESAGDEYAFVQEALRTELARSLTPARSQELHERWAKYLLEHADQDESRQLEAGWHLVHTRDELRGAALLARVAPGLVDRRESLATAVPALERALEVFERHDQALSKRLRVRAQLVLAGYLFDYRLAARYGESSIDAIYPFTGLADIARCTRWLGKRAGFVAGFVWSSLRRLLRPRQRRGPHVAAALKYYAMSTMGLLGLRALAINVDGVSAVFQRMRSFDGAPYPTLDIVYLAARAIRLHGQGRGAEVHGLLEHAVRRLELEGPGAWNLTEHERADLMIGVLLTHGINEAYRERAQSLACAEKLERIGTPLAIAASLRVSMTYYLLRGDAARAHHFRRLLDLKAIENGSSWQVEWIAVPLEGLAAAVWTDLLGMRRTLDRLDRLVEQEPSFVHMRDTVRIPYLFRRGDYGQVTVLGEAFIKAHPPRTLIGWAVTYAMVALAYVELGRAERALEICEAALAHVSEADREYFVMYTPLEAAYAAALALKGEFERSDEIFRARSARMAASDEPVCVAVMYEYRIKVARMRGDQAALSKALAELNVAALSSRNPGIVALAHRLCHARSMQPEARARDSVAYDAARAQVHTVTDYLADVESVGERAQQALAVLSHYVGSVEGYLYLSHGAASLQLTASLDEHIPPDALLASLQQMAAANDTQSCTRIGDDYYAYKLQSGFAVLRAANTQNAELPESLLAEVDLSLRRGAGLTSR